MVHLLLAIIYIAFISLGLPDSLLGAAWPVMHEDLGGAAVLCGHHLDDYCLWDGRLEPAE